MTEWNTLSADRQPPPTKLSKQVSQNIANYCNLSGNYRKLSELSDKVPGPIRIQYFNYWNYQTGIITICEDTFDLK